MNKVKIFEKGGKLTVNSPYHPDFPRYAKHLGGRWKSEERLWVFDIRDEQSVRDLCRDCFGTDGEDTPQFVNCLVELTSQYKNDLWFGGRRIASRPGRDWPVKLGPNVVLRSGEFYSSGGSRKNPRITFHGDSVTLEVRDVPLPLARQELERVGWGKITILADDENLPIPVNAELSSEAFAILVSLRKRLELTDGEIISVAILAYHAAKY